MTSTESYLQTRRYLDGWFATHDAIISRAQALEAGLSAFAIARLVRSGGWIRVYPNVYRLAASPMTPMAWIRAALLTGGPDAYVSPNWYATKRETGKVVPTWNYLAIHAYGRVEFFEDAERLRAIVTSLTQRHEGRREKPWAVSDAPEDYIQAQLRGIIGFRLPIDRLEGKWKLSQNRPEADRRGVIEALEGEGGALESAVAQRMKDGL